MKQLHSTILAMSLVGLFTTITGCAKTVRPHVFTTTATASATVNHAVRVLAQHGLTVDRVDERAGVVQSLWQATNFRYGQNEAGATRFITRRFTITVSPQATGSRVLVRAEDMACVNPDAFIAGDATFADCKAVSGIVPPDQALLDRVGRDLASALGVSPGQPVVGQETTSK